MERHEVRREHDDELEGFVVPAGDDAWRALTVFGGELGRGPTRVAAESIVRRRGLASLAERWHWFSRTTGAWEVVVLQEAHPGRVRVAVGWYSMPGVPVAVITEADLAAGDRLQLDAPPDDEPEAADAAP